jgi:hypothetical protein
MRAGLPAATLTPFWSLPGTNISTVPNTSLTAEPFNAVFDSTARFFRRLSAAAAVILASSPLERTQDGALRRPHPPSAPAGDDTQWPSKVGLALCVVFLVVGICLALWACALRTSNRLEIMWDKHKATGYDESQNPHRDIDYLKPTGRLRPTVGSAALVKHEGLLAAELAQAKANTGAPGAAQATVSGSRRDPKKLDAV